jgi:uncharacterized membrane protein YebE (DUF533 family)
MDPEKILRELSKGGLGGGLGGLGGGLGGLLGGGRRKKGGSQLLKLGTLAAVGAVAYKAYQAYQQNQQNQGGVATQAPAHAGSATPTAGAAAAAGAFTATTSGASGAPTVDGLTLLRAMIAAAKADGQIDAAESQQIMAQVGRAALSADEKAFLLDELARPLNLDAVIAGVRTPQQAAEVYTASRLVIAEASAAEQAYLGLLAARLGLDARATRELDAAVQALPG